MGRLVYADQSSFDIDDRTLSHLKLAVSAKLRRGESFTLNWVVPAQNGSGRVALWLSASIPLQFQFSASVPDPVNRTWLEALMTSAWGGEGMTLMPEEDASEYLARSRSASRSSAPR